MNIKWRLSTLLIQVAVLSAITCFITGKPYSGATWFVAGIFSVIINPQILEPFYSRPADVIGNGAISILLYLTTEKGIAKPGWDFLLIILILAIVLAILSLVLGTGNKENSQNPLSRITSILSREASAIRIYSVIFWLSLIDTYSLNTIYFWWLAGTWAFLVLLGAVNWQRLWGFVQGTPSITTIEGMIGPNTLLVASGHIPNIGEAVSINTGSFSTQGVVLSRIRRKNDIWAKVYINSPEECEFLVGKNDVSMIEISDVAASIIGSVEPGSNETTIVFSPTKILSIGDVVSVEDGEQDILYQINTAYINKETSKDGSRLQISSKAMQIGQFDYETYQFNRYDWVPSPGSTVHKPSFADDFDNSNAPENWIHLGDLVGCNIPIFMDMDILIEGHLSILGMTKMGKSTLANFIAKELSTRNFVTILDQTGEYRTKRGIPTHTIERDMCKPSIAVFEPELGSTAPDVALKCLNKVVDLARVEYDKEDPYPRVFLIDEAHQFIPEPAVLGYGGAGRESSIKIGALMMQIRKYRISMILISQRTAVIAKSAISQCENIIAFRSVDQTGLNYLESIIGPEACKFIPLLNQGQALCYGPAFSSDTPVIINCVHH